YTWLGACWLYWRCEGGLQRRSGRQAKALGAVTLVLLAVLVAWTTVLNTQYAHRLSEPLVWLPGGSLVIALLVGFILGFRSPRQYLPLFTALGVFVLAFV